MGEETQDLNIDEIKPLLEEKGFVLQSKQEAENFKSSLDTLKKQELKQTWDKIDSTIYELTGIEKKIRDDHGMERTVDYYQRALSELKENNKGLSKKADDSVSQLKEYESQLEALKSENPEAKYEEKFKELRKQLKDKEEEAEAKMQELQNSFQGQIFEKEINSTVDALRPILKKDVEYLEDIIDSKKRAVMSLESKTTEDGKRVFYKNGEPLLTDDGTFKTASDIMKESLASIVETTVIKEGTGSKGSEYGNTTVKQFSNAQEMDAYLKDKHGAQVGSVEWREERAKIKAGNNF